MARVVLGLRSRVLRVFLEILEVECGRGMLLGIFSLSWEGSLDIIILVQRCASFGVAALSEVFIIFINMKQYQSAHKGYRSSYSSRKTAQSEPKKNNQKESVVFMAVDEEHMGMHLPYSLSNDMIRGLVKENGGAWCHNFKIWKIPKESYTIIRTEIPRILPEVLIEDLPLFIDRALRPITEKLHIHSINHTLLYDPLDRKILPEDNPLYPKLYEFQRETLRLATRNFGRLMIADEMGVGKTLQSLACALTYERDWPLLIICPSALKNVWRQQIKKWLSSHIQKEAVQIIEKFGQQISQISKIVIISYEIAAKSIDVLGRFQVIIADEAHYLKNDSAKRTENILPLLTTRKRIFLLSGTPALARPREIFNLIQVIRPDIFTGLKEFGDRYCCMQRSRWTNKMEYEGCRNIAELHFILKNRVMIRRLKSEVLHQLPSKQRQIIYLETNKAQVKEIKELMSSNQIPMDVLRNSDKLAQEGETSENEGMSPLPRCYLLSGLAKIEPTKTYLTSLFENDVKVLIFAHHRAVIEDLSTHLERIKCEFIKIDGSTSNDSRKKLVKNFQENHMIRAALLSITAAGVGITLTAASTVVFAELHWTPANLIQAEDRAHRIGQKASVNIHYLIGENTLDNLLLRQLEKKLQTTGNILSGSKDSFGAEVIKQGQLGRISVPNRERAPNAQRSILEFARPRPTREGSQSDSDIDDEQIPEDELEKMIAAKEEQIKEKIKMKALLEVGKKA